MTSGTVHEFPDVDNGEALTARQRLILETIRASVTDRGYPPSMREIGESVGLTSTSSVTHQLSALEAKGYLRRDPHRPRAIEVVMPDAVPSPSQPRLGAECGLLPHLSVGRKYRRCAARWPHRRRWPNPRRAVR